MSWQPVRTCLLEKFIIKSLVVFSGSDFRRFQEGCRQQTPANPAGTEPPRRTALRAVLDPIRNVLRYVPVRNDVLPCRALCYWKFGNSGLKGKRRPFRNMPVVTNNSTARFHPLPCRVPRRETGKWQGTAAEV